MIYKFEQFNVEIKNPTVTVELVNDVLENKECSVSVILTTDTTRFCVLLYGFTYTDTWEDADVIAWVDNKLKEYEVPQ